MTDSTPETGDRIGRYGLFVCYAPYEAPRMAMAIRIANGYSSEYCVDTSKDIINYYAYSDTFESDGVQPFYSVSRGVELFED